jgi:hypothetical protein
MARPNPSPMPNPRPRRSLRRRRRPSPPSRRRRYLPSPPQDPPRSPSPSLQQRRPKPRNGRKSSGSIAWRQVIYLAVGWNRLIIQDICVASVPSRRSSCWPPRCLCLRSMGVGMLPLVVATVAALGATAVSAAAIAAFPLLDPTPAVAPEQGMVRTLPLARVLTRDREDTLRPSIRRSMHTRPTTLPL